uniref:Uncharacterized protein n=1 Tax=Acrobeloides nanus TaxID=290746 RepID=A0A914CMC5_9BILA
MAQISDPPPYEEAIRMDIATLNKPPRRSLSQPLTHDTVRVLLNSGRLRVAPERPLSSRVAPIQDELLSQGPPSYETAINSTESTNSSPIPTSTRENFSRRQSLY